MRVIGGSIHEAIDWTQDRLRTTRPLAERTLFVLLAEKRVTETESGFMLTENDGNDDETKKIHKRLTSLRSNMKHRPRSHQMQKNVNEMRTRLRQGNVTMQPNDNTEDATDAIS